RILKKCLLHSRDLDILPHSAAQLSLQLLNTTLARFALPNHVNAPTAFPELRTHHFVSIHVRAKFLLPERDVRFRVVRVLASRMSVPKTPVNKHRRPQGWKNDIRPSW